MDSSTFLEVLRQSRLLTDQQLAQVARKIGQSGGSTEMLTSSLVGEGLLTPFQVRRLTAGQTRGLTLGQYRILDEIGSGGFGQVYRALHTVMGRVVAVKVIAPQLVEDERARTWFKREVRAVTQLYHPNIVMAFDANEADGLLFLVMEYVDGLDLETLVRKQGPLAINTAYEMMRQAGRALQYAHERGMVHRDIKPANLLIPRSQNLPGSAPADGAPAATAPVVVKIVDFGLARLHSTANGQTAKTEGGRGFLGTADYVSPEQARNASRADIRSDLYSLGCAFYYALAGRKPFRGDTVFETLVKHWEEEALPLESLRPEVPLGMSAVVRRLMAKDPGKRFQTPAELVAELDFLAGRETAVVRPVGGAPVFLPPPSRAAPVLPPPPVVWKSPTPGRDPDANLFATQASPLFGAGVPGDLTDAAPVPQPTAILDAEVDAAAAAGGVTVATDVTPLPPGRLSATELDLGGTHDGVALDPACPAPSGPFAADTPAPSENSEPARTVALGPEAVAGQVVAIGLCPVTEPQDETSHDAARTGPAPCDNARFFARWRQWRAVVELFAAGIDECPIGESDYRALHRELLSLCRDRVATTTGPDRDIARALESLVEPWVSLHAFTATGREVLSSLLARCRQVEVAAFGRQGGAPVLGWVTLLAAAVAAAVVGVYVQGQIGWKPPQILSLSSLRRLVTDHPALTVAVTVVAAIYVSVHFALRPSRR